MDCVDAVSRTEAVGRMNADCCWWSLVLVAATDCCCWLLLLIVAVYCFCWLLLLIAAADCCCWLLLVGCCCWLSLMIAAVECCCWLPLLVAAQKVFEYFRVVGDLRLRQICRRKSLWIFSGCWSRVFEYFQNNDGRKVDESFASGKLGSWRQRVNEYYGCALGIYTRYFQDGRRLSESQ